MVTIKERVGMAPLLERQAGLLEIRRRLVQEGGTAARKGRTPLEQGPWITLSKTLGADWEPVARRLGERLGWQVFDREILEEISRESHIREAVLSLMDEREVGWMEETLARIVVPERPGQYDFLDQMARVILTLGRQGRTILVGRGANWLLEPRCGVRVRMVSPMPVRLARVAEREGLPPAEARERIAEDDAARARFIRQVYRKDINDPSGYDLILNLGSLQTEAAVDCILAVLRSKVGEVALGEE